MAKEAREDGEDDLCTLYLDSIDPIIEEIIQSVELLAQHSYGCRAVQMMVEYCVEPQRSKVLDSIIACQQNILCHTYGNYVIQKVLQHGRPSDKDAIFKLITSYNSVIMFSKQKQASNVVEAVLRLGDANQRQQIVQEMLNVSFFFDLVYLTVVIDTLMSLFSFSASVSIIIMRQKVPSCPCLKTPTQIMW